MMLRVIAGAGALVWMSAVGPVLAADIPAAPIVKAPIRAPAYSWYGFYIGVHGGYGWSKQSVQFVPDVTYAPAFLPGALPTSMAADAKGFIGGVQWGSNWQFGSVVLGTDSDFSYADIKDSQTIVGTLGGLPITGTASQRLKWFGTTKLRGGILATENLLLYATGGLATGRVESTASINFAGLCAIPGNCAAGAAAKDKWGWAIGGGIEYADGPWQFRVEYLHYDLGTLNYPVRDPLLPFAAIAASTKFSGDMVRGGISYRFNWTPWELIFGRGS